MKDLTLETIDTPALTPLVRAALGIDRAEITGWSHAPFGHSLDEVYGTTPSIFRFSGTADAGAGEIPWAIVLKVVAAAGTPDDPSSPANGDREPLAYQSGFLAGITGVRAPRCFGAIERHSGGWWLWLEHVVDTIGREWPVDRYLLAARHLGRFNAANPAAQASYPWLSRSPLGDAVAEMSPGLARLADARDNAFVAQAISPDAAAALLTLPAKLPRWLARLDALPQTICHWDAHRANLVSREGPGGAVETIALDWAGVGLGAAGTDLSKLLSQTVNFFGLAPDALPALDAELFQYYMRGLKDEGWRGDERDVRFAYTAASAARLVVRAATAVELALNPRARAGFERAAGMPFPALAGKFKDTLPYYLSLAGEAERLADGA